MFVEQYREYSCYNTVVIIGCYSVVIIQYKVVSSGLRNKRPRSVYEIIYL